MAETTDKFESSDIPWLNGETMRWVRGKATYTVRPNLRSNCRDHCTHHWTRLILSILLYLKNLKKLGSSLYFHSGEER